jgi:hypothetical protein
MARAATSIPRFAALFGLLVLFVGFVVIVAGLASIQKKTNALGPAAKIPAATVATYNTVFTEALVTPYPAEHGFQFAFIWFIIFFNLFNFLLVSAIVALPRVAFVGRNAALTLLAIATTLTINVINNLQFMQKNDFAKAAFTKEIINVTYAGAILVTLGDFFIILALGIWEHEHPYAVENPHYDTHKRAGEPAVATTTAV